MDCRALPDYKRVYCCLLVWEVIDQKSPLSPALRAQRGISDLESSDDPVESLSKFWVWSRRSLFRLSGDRVGIWE